MPENKLTEEAFYSLIQPETKLKYARKEGIHSSEVRHIRAIVDEQVVYRTWNKYKKRWNYSLIDSYSLWLEYEAGWITILK
jgi:hypothetical protein